MFSQPAPDPTLNDTIYIFVDPAAGGPGSDYAVLSFQRSKGLITVGDQCNRFIAHSGDLWQNIF